TQRQFDGGGPARAEQDVPGVVIRRKFRRQAFDVRSEVSSPGAIGIGGLKRFLHGGIGERPGGRALRPDGRTSQKCRERSHLCHKRLRDCTGKLSTRSKRFKGGTPMGTAAPLLSTMERRR